MSLRHLINKEKVTSTKKQSSTYNKRTFPFEMTNSYHVESLQIICDMFCNPWEFSNTKRTDLTDDICDYFNMIHRNELIVLTAKEYNALVANQKKSRKKKSKT